MNALAAGRCCSTNSLKYGQSLCRLIKTSILSREWEIAQKTNCFDWSGWVPSQSKNFRAAWGWFFTQFPSSAAASGLLSAHLSIPASRGEKEAAGAEGGGTFVAQPWASSEATRIITVLKRFTTSS